MKNLKKLLSLILGICTLFTGISNASTVFGISSKDNTNVLVIGTESSQKKFAKMLFPDEEVKLGMPKKFDNMNLLICEDYFKESEIISEYISKSCATDISGRHKFHTIIATVDVKQNVEKVYSEMDQLVNFICDNKQPFIQIVIVGCAESANNIDFNAFANYTVTIERYNTANGWGKDHNKRFDGTGQFLSFFALYKDSKDTIPGFIAEVEDDYDFCKKRSKSGTSVLCDFVRNLSCVVIVGSVIGWLAMSCKDDIVERKHFEVVPKEKIYDINKRYEGERYKSENNQIKAGRTKVGIQK